MRCSLPLILFGSILVPCLFAQKPEIEIQKVDFTLVDQTGVKDPWYEVAISLQIVRGGSEVGSNPRFVDEVSVSLSLAFEVKVGSEPRFDFYFAAAEFATIEVGRSVVRFYIPPELVKRDRIRGEPFAFEIEVQGEGESLASVVSRNLDGAVALESFRSKVDLQGVTDILRSQNETPFWLSSPRDTPNAKLRLAEE